jgi:TetR/AcrR family transcriptional repressor of nem operon
MPYPTNHRPAVRKCIIDSARRLFNRNGFENVSIQKIMAGAGRTHGGFYSYFQSKSDLYAEVLSCFFTDPDWKNSWEGVEIDMRKDLGPQVVRAYLSRQHFEDVENSCPMVALPTDVSRSGRPAKAAFEKVFCAMVDLLERSSNKRSSSRPAEAKAIAALCVGGMVIARAMDERGVADELRDACMSVAFELGGWGNGNLSKGSRVQRFRKARPRA